MNLLSFRMRIAGRTAFRMLVNLAEVNYVYRGEDNGMWVVLPCPALLFTMSGDIVLSVSWLNRTLFVVFSFNDG